MLRVMGVTKRFGDVEAVKGVSFDVPAGGSYGLLGPNGAGKSTTISMICGLLAPDSGEVLVKGVCVAKEPDKAKALMGVVPQDIALYPTLSARENLAFWGTMYGLAGKELASAIDEALLTVGLQDRQKDRISTYSGGMKRRINIAASLMHKPELLVMDEPTVGIDPQSRINILETIRQLNQQGMTVLYTSHYMEEVEYLCDAVAIIDHGSVIAQGTLDEVRRLAGTEATVTLRVTTPDGEVVSRISAVEGVRHVDCEGDSIEVLVDGAPAALPLLMDAVAACGRKVHGVVIQEPNLETVFLKLTGRALRD